MCHIQNQRKKLLFSRLEIGMINPYIIYTRSLRELKVIPALLSFINIKELNILLLFMYICPCTGRVITYYVIETISIAFLLCFCWFLFV